MGLPPTTEKQDTMYQRTPNSVSPPHPGCSHNKRNGTLAWSHTAPRLVPPYLGGPIAVDDHREGVIGQIPCSHMAHLKLEDDFIWGVRKHNDTGPKPGSP